MEKALTLKEVAEKTGLHEATIQYTCKRIVSSNLTLSAINIKDLRHTEAA